MLKLLREKTGEFYFYSLILLVISLPLSRFGLSIAQFSILGIWLIEGNFRKKLQLLWHNKAALVLISFYILHLIGIFYSTNIDYALKDIRVKLPLLFLPVIFASVKPLETKKVNIILLVYFLAVLVATLISLGIFLFGNINNFRELSPFISHIRLSLNVCLAIFFGAYFCVKVYYTNRLIIGLFSLSIVWLALFLIMIESVTGLIVLLIVGYLLVIISLFKIRSNSLKLMTIILIIIIPLFISFYLNHTYNGYAKPYYNDLNNLEHLTSEGNPYMHDTVYQPIENGSYIGLYICEPELRKSWNSISDYKYDGLDKRDQNLKYTLIRYLNSKNLRKDASGLSQLSKKDILNIEKGIANVYYTRPLSLNSRLYKLFWEYSVITSKGNPGGHSIIQRFEFWKVSIAIVEQNFLFGVGTGDIQEAYADMYEETASVLKPQWRHRAHNQFLAVFVTFGAVGFIWFLASLIYPGIKMRKFGSFRYFVFFLTIILSMLFEDTLETQMGVSLYAFFNSFLLFAVKK